MMNFGDKWKRATDQILLHLARVGGSVLARNTAWMGAGQGLRVISQAAYFVLIARSLGAHEYGVFVGVTAFAAIAAPFASWGSGNLLIRAVAIHPSHFARYWGNALLTTAISGALLSGALISVAHFVISPTVPAVLVALVVTADLFLGRVADTSGQAFQAVQRLKRTAQIHVLPNLLRLGAIAALACTVPRPEAIHWAALYWLSSALTAGFCLWRVTTELGRPEWTLQPMRMEWKDGCYFALSFAAQNIYNDIDKTLLARLASFGAAGIYAAAYRIVDVAFAPVRSLLHASYGRFFQHGARGVHGSFEFARRLLPFAAGYGVLAAAVLYASAPLVPYFFGSAFAGTAHALRWLALLPLLKVLHYLAADSLTGAGYQGLRTSVQIAVGATNVALNLWLIPLYSWRGAAWASLICDALLALSLWVVIGLVMSHSVPERKLRMASAAV